MRSPKQKRGKCCATREAPLTCNPPHTLANTNMETLAKTSRHSVKSSTLDPELATSCRTTEPPPEAMAGEAAIMFERLGTRPDHHSVVDPGDERIVSQESATEFRRQLARSNRAQAASEVRFGRVPAMTMITTIIK